MALAKYLRGESDSWIPRVPSFPFPLVVECGVAAQECVQVGIGVHAE